MYKIIDIPSAMPTEMPTNHVSTYGLLSARTNVQVNLLNHTAAGSAFGRARSSVAEGGSPLQLLVYWLSTRWSMCAGVGKEGGSWERLPLLSEGCATFPPLLQAGQRCNVSGRLKNSPNERLPSPPAPMAPLLIFPLLVRRGRGGKGIRLIKEIEARTKTAV